MSDTCCHLKVTRQRLHKEGLVIAEWWKCDTCDTQFSFAATPFEPVPVVQTDSPWDGIKAIRERNKDKAWAAASLAASELQCAGYPDCDGDLPGEGHEPSCPLYPPQPAEQQPELPPIPDDLKVDWSTLSEPYTIPASLDWAIERDKNMQMFARELIRRLAKSQQAFIDLQLTDRESLTETLAAALDQQQRAEKAEGLRDEWCAEYMKVRDQLSCALSQVRALQVDVERLREVDRKCGKENCMGQKVEGARWWVTKELFDNTKAELAILRESHEALLEAAKTMVSPVEHRDGCLWKADKRMPCQCGYNQRINDALTNTRAAISRADKIGGQS